MDKIDSWILNRGGVTYDCEELSVLDLVGKTAAKTNEVVDKVTTIEDSNNKKVSHDEMKFIYKHEGADFKGSWHGIEKPQFAEPGIAGVVDSLVSQMDEKANKLETSKMEENIKNISIVSDINNINTLISQGFKRFKLPSGKFKVSLPIELIGNVEIYGNKDTILFADTDISIFKVKSDNQVHSNIYLHDLQVGQEFTGVATKVPIDLGNANMCRIERVLCYSTNTNINSKSGLSIYNTTSEHVYSLLMDKCDFRNSSVDINITDCYISNTNIWGVNRQYALHIGKSSQQLLNLQLVGGDTKGALWIEDTVLGQNIEIIKGSNLYFDGSYSEIQSGCGINAKGMRYSSFNNCTLWFQKKEGMILENCFGNTFDNIVFEGNCRNNMAQGILNNGEMADIVIKGLFYDNNFSNCIFTCEMYHIRQRVFNSVNASTFDGHYNKINNFTVVDVNNYVPSDITFKYVGLNNTGLTNYVIGEIAIL